MIKIAICDDDKNITDKITALLSGCGGLDGTSPEVFHSGEELIDRKADFDIIILDMEMPGLDGIETARILRQTDEDFILIYLTAFKEKICSAFEVGAFRYLLKPVSADKFLEAISAAVERINKDSLILIRSTADELHSVRLSRIVYFETVERRVLVRLADRELTSAAAISDYERELKGRGFYRTHRAFLVNFGHVERVLNDRVILDNGEAVKLSRLRRADFLECYHRFVRSKLR